MASITEGVNEVNIEEIKLQIENITNLSEELKPEEFSEEGGLADSLVLYLITKSNARKSALTAAEKKKNFKLKSTQLRKVFNSIKTVHRDLQTRINRDENFETEVFDRSRISKLMVNLAYARGRELLPDDFYDILQSCLHPDRLKTNKDFIRVAEFVEAIMAYHKFRDV